MLRENKIFVVVQTYKKDGKIYAINISEVKTTKESAQHFAELLNSENFSRQGIFWEVKEMFLHD